MDLEPGSEVIIPAFTFWIDPAVVVLAGLTPVFVDVELDSLNIDPSLIEPAITARTKVILAPHLNGLAMEMDSIMAIAKKHGLRVIEDSARTCGGRYKEQRVGSFDIGAFSFGYGKSFYGFGGGMLTSNDSAFIERVRTLQKEDFHNISTMELYKAIIKGSLLKFLNTPIIHGTTLFQAAHYVIWSKRKRELQEHLLQHNIDAQDESAQDVSQMEQFRQFAVKPYPNAAILEERLCYVPAHPCLDENDLGYISDKIRSFFSPSPTSS